MELRPGDRPGMVIQGVKSPWNLHVQDGRLSGLPDFELAHRDHRIADFALSWRGKHDAIIRACSEVSPLEPEEWALLAPVWWSWLIAGACKDLTAGTRGDDWAIRHLLRRSPLMGRDGVAFG